MAFNSPPRLQKKRDSLKNSADKIFRRNFLSKYNLIFIPCYNAVQYREFQRNYSAIQPGGLNPAFILKITKELHSKQHINGKRAKTNNSSRQQDRHLSLQELRFNQNGAGKISRKNRSLPAL